MLLLETASTNFSGLNRRKVPVIATVRWYSRSRRIDSGTMSSTNSTEQKEAQQPLKKRAVVSSFLFKFPEGDSKKPLVALFRRSGQVSTYRQVSRHCLNLFHALLLFSI